MGKFTEWMNSKIKRLDWFDMKLIKWSVLFFTLWLVFAFTVIRDALGKVNPWIWLGLGILAAARPCYRAYIKEHTGIGFKVGAKITRSKTGKKK